MEREARDGSLHVVVAGADMSSLNGCCCALCCRENEEQRWIIRKRKRRKTLRDPPSIARFLFKRTSPDFDLFSSKPSVCFPSVRPFLLPASYQLINPLYPTLHSSIRNGHCSNRRKTQKGSSSRLVRRHGPWYFHGIPLLVRIPHSCDPPARCFLRQARTGAYQECLVKILRHGGMDYGYLRYKAGPYEVNLFKGTVVRSVENDTYLVLFPLH